MTRPLAIAIAPQTSSSIEQGRHKRQRVERDREQEQTGARERGFAKHFHQPADQSALQDDADDSDESKDVTRLTRVVAETLFGEEREERRHDRETGDGEKIGGHDGAEKAAVAVLKDFRETASARAAGSDVRRKGFPAE